MAIMGLIPKDATPAKRVAVLAERMAACQQSFNKGGLTGPELTLYTKLSGMMCWDAALYCAWSAKGIECAEMNMSASQFSVVSAADFKRLFPAPLKKVADAGALKKLPEGCFVGFVSGGELRHAMLHVGKGQGAGNKNNCIFSAASPAGVGWEAIDMTAFFGKDKAVKGNGSTDMVWAATDGRAV